MSLKHRFVSPKPDGPDATKLRPSNWNDEHIFTGGDDGALLMRDSGVDGGADWLDPSNGFLASLDGNVAYRALTADDIPALPYVPAFSNQNANVVLAGPATGSASAPAFRALVAADIPTLAYASLSGLPTLGGAAALNIGTAAGTVAAGDHLHTGVYQPLFDPTKFYVDASTGYVGIGTNTPAKFVDIWKSSTSGDSNVFPTVRVRNTSTSKGNGLTTFNVSEFKVSAGNDAVVGGLWASYDDLLEGTCVGSAGAKPTHIVVSDVPKVTVDINGRLGVGTTAPATMLDVIGVATIRGASKSTQTGLITTSADGLIAENTSASTSGVPVQYSPRLRFTGHAWNTTATAADNYLESIVELRPTSGATPSSTMAWAFRRSTDGSSGSFVDGMTLNDSGVLEVLPAGANVGEIRVYQQRASSTDYARIFLKASGNIAQILAASSGTGPSLALRVGTVDSGTLGLYTANVAKALISTAGLWTFTKDSTHGFQLDPQTDNVAQFFGRGGTDVAELRANKFTATSTIRSNSGFNVNGTNGFASATFTTNDGKTVTVLGGLVTNVV